MSTSLNRKSISGVSLVETMVWVALSSILGVVAYTFFAQSQKLAQTAFNAQELLSSRTASLQFIMEDLRSAKRSSLGNLILNGNFEDTTDGTTPKYWSNTIAVGVGNVELVSNTISTPAVHSGIRALTMSEWAYDNAYYYNQPIKLIPGNAYMLSGWGWIKDPLTSVCSVVELTDSSNASLAGIGWFNNSSWTRQSVRYPATGTYVAGTVSGDLVKVRIVTMAGVGKAYFDDITLTSLNHVMTSEIASEINTNQIATLGTAAENCGFKFLKVDRGIQSIFRYRLQSNGKDYDILREIFNDTSNVWTAATPSKIATGVTNCKIYLSATNTLPSTGADSPITVYLNSIPSSMKNQNKAAITNVTIYPRTP